VATDLVIRRYDGSQRAAWDAFVQRSKNGTFLFIRDYMDYHRDQFEDHSLLILAGSAIVALFPANRVGDAVYSHQGLTYGGFVTDQNMTTPRFLDVFAATLSYLRGMHFCRLFYKTVPTIYHLLPAEEDRFALFRADAILYRRDVLSVIAMPALVPLQARRRRGIAKAAAGGVTLAASDDWPAYWRLLADHLMDRFGAKPVHSFVEIENLRTRFPANIHLHVASLKETVLAGVVIYESARVAHLQYAASSAKGREVGALDALFVHLLSDVYCGKAFFDFGMSNSEEGRELNVGLIEQKEGFGARACVHDFYELRL
jgi:Acetyltransferase (GNAT) domain